MTFWSKVRLKNLCVDAGQYGLNTSAENYVETGVRLLRTTDISSGTLTPREEGVFVSELPETRFTLEAGDLLLSRSGTPPGQSYLVRSADTGATFAGYLVRFRPLPSVEPRFLAYVARSEPFQHTIRSESVASTIQNFNAERYANIEFRVPDSVEQRRIADFLDAETSRLDGLSGTQVRLIERLTEREGVAIELTLSAAASSSVRLKRLLTAPMSYGANESTQHDRRDWPRYIRTTDIANDGTLRDETFASLPPEIARNYTLRDGDLLFVRSGATVGKSFVYESQYGPAAHAGYLIRARVNSDLISSRLIWFFCQTKTYWQQVGEEAIKATIQNVNAEKYGNLLVPLVDVERQASTLASLDSQMAKSQVLKRRAVQMLELIAERRQALITAAVTGQFDVSTASGRNVTDGVSA